MAVQLQLSMLRCGYIRALSFWGFARASMALWTSWRHAADCSANEAALPLAFQDDIA